MFELTGKLAYNFNLAKIILSHGPKLMSIFAEMSDFLNIWQNVSESIRRAYSSTCKAEESKIDVFVEQDMAPPQNKVYQ